MSLSVTSWRRAVAVAAVASLVALAAGCSSSPTTGGSSTSQTSSASSAASTPSTAANAGQCVYKASGKAAKPAVLPSGDNIATTGTVDVTMHMDAGDVAMTLDRVGAPCAVNSFESLAKQGYFDDTSCHRLVPGFVLQCGDPTGTGAGGPGYSFADELSGKETYPYGTVAMANAGANTNGSQFFIVIGDDAQSLPPSYDVLGTVDSASMAVIEAIAAQGVDPSDAQGIRPAEGGHITSVTAS